MRTEDKINQNSEENVELDSNKKSKKVLIDKISYIISGITLLVAVGMVIYCVNTLSTITRLNEAYKDNIEASAELAITLNEIKTLQEQYGISLDYNDKDCEYNAVAGYLYAMGDKYARYNDPDMQIDQVDADNESGLGIGIQVVSNEKGLLVAKVYQNTPAEMVGLQRFDLITAVNGVQYNIEEFDKIVNLIKGKPGDIVSLNILRDGKDINIEVTIAEYTINSVEGRILNDIAIIDIDDFTLKSAEEFSAVMDKYHNQGIEKYIIDLRNNTGGFLDTVVPMIDYMVPEGIIVEVTDNKDNIIQTLKSDSKEFNGNIVVLTNKWTASASELFAQSMKDFNKATIIGENTYGKGTVLGTFNLRNGGSVSISTGYYLTNSGAQLEGIGVKPDIEVGYEDYSYSDYFTIPEDTDIQLQEAIKFLT